MSTDKPKPQEEHRSVDRAEEALNHDQQEVMPFVSTNSLEDGVLIILALITGISLVVLMIYWFYYPVVDFAHNESRHTMHK
jgi:hypothetical protein